MFGNQRVSGIWHPGHASTLDLARILLIVNFANTTTGKSATCAAQNDPGILAEVS